jgi:hypothetical protein
MVNLHPILLANIVGNPTKAVASIVVSLLRGSRRDLWYCTPWTMDTKMKLVNRVQLCAYLGELDSLLQRYPFKEFKVSG